MSNAGFGNVRSPTRSTQGDGKNQCTASRASTRRRARRPEGHRHHADALRRQGRHGAEAAARDPHRPRAPAAPSPRRRRGRRRRVSPGARSSSATASRCGTRRARSCAPGSRPLDGPAPVRPAHGAVADRRSRSACVPCAVLEPDLIVNTGDNLGHVDGQRGRRVRARAVPRRPRRVRPRLERLLGPSLKNPLRYFSGAERHARQGDPSRPRHRPAWRRSSSRLGWLDLNNTARAIEIRGIPPRALRHQRRPPRLGPARPAPRALDEPARERRLEDDDGPDAGAQHRRHPRALPARAQRLRQPGRRRRSSPATRTAARCASPGCRRARHQLRHPPRAGAGPQPLAARDARAPTSRSPPGSAPRSTRRSGSPAARGGRR